MITRANEPQSIGGVLDTGFKIFGAGFMAIVPITFLGTLISAIAGYALTMSMFDAAEAGDPMAGLGAAGVISFIVVLIISLVFFGAALIRTRHIARNEQGSFGSALAGGFKRFPSVLVASIAYGIAIMIGFIALVIPGIFLSVALAFCLYAAAADNKGPFEALSYSYDIVRGNWWRSAAVLTVILIILIVFQLTIVFAAGLFAVAGDPTMGPNLILDVVITPIIGSIISTLSYCLAFAVYDDLKLRKEGSDLADRIEGLGEEA
ncbi:MAG: hypothetical protein QNJ00_02985 [Woeseiaceae bacterium]|nr:hypothetical protein [Woeseiaceae bacterium]